MQWNSKQWYGATGRHYFVERHNQLIDSNNQGAPSNWLAHDQTGYNLLTLGSWYGIRGRVICFRDPSASPIPNSPSRPSENLTTLPTHSPTTSPITTSPTHSSIKGSTSIVHSSNPTSRDDFVASSRKSSSNSDLTISLNVILIIPGGLLIFAICLFWYCMRQKRVHAVHLQGNTPDSTDVDTCINVMPLGESSPYYSQDPNVGEAPSDKVHLESPRTGIMANIWTPPAASDIENETGYSRGVEKVTAGYVDAFGRSRRTDIQKQSEGLFMDNVMSDSTDTNQERMLYDTNRNYRGTEEGEVGRTSFSIHHKLSE